jgi:H+/Cl- antiporter ClcA
MPRSYGPSFARRLRELGRHDLFAPTQWRRRVALWSGGVLVGLAAIAFARAGDLAYAGFGRLLAASPWLPLLVTPAAFALLAWLTQGAWRATQGSGIPQVIAALAVEDEGFRRRLLALPVALGKIALTLLALLGGASVGREGPTVHVGAGLMHALGRRFGYTDPKALSRFVLAGAVPASPPRSTRRWPASCSRSRSSPAPGSTASAASC